MTRFWALVDNNKKLKKDHRHGSTGWFKVYSMLFILMAAAGFLYALYNGEIGPFSLLAFIPAFLFFVAIFNTLSLINQEWKQQTITWWLTIPCSRSELLAAKMVGALIRLIKIAAVTIVVMVLLALGGILFKPEIWTMPAICTAAIMAAKLYLLIIIISPLAIAMGMFFGVMIHSRIKPLAPFVIGFAVSVFIAAQDYLLPIFAKVDASGQLPLIPNIPVLNLSLTTIVIKVGLLLLIAAVMFALSSYLLAEQTEV